MKLTIVVLTVVLSAACGAPPPVRDAARISGSQTGITTPAGSQVDVSVLREAYAGIDYRTYPSLRALVDDAAVVATGTVQSFADGQAWRSDRGENVAGVRHRYAVMEVNAKQVFKGRKHLSDGQLYVQLYRGVEALDETGDVLQQSVTTPEALRKAIPAGTPVTVLASLASPEGSDPRERPSAGRAPPQDAVLLEPKIEGLVFDGGPSRGAMGGLTAIPRVWLDHERQTSDRMSFREVVGQLDVPQPQGN